MELGSIWEAGGVFSGALVMGRNGDLTQDVLAFLTCGGGLPW
jgi:hypothetical protein